MNAYYTLYAYHHFVYRLSFWIIQNAVCIIRIFPKHKLFFVCGSSVVYCCLPSFSTHIKSIRLEIVRFVSPKILVKPSKLSIQSRPIVVVHIALPRDARFFPGALLLSHYAEFYDTFIVRRTDGIVFHVVCGGWILMSIGSPCIFVYYKLIVKSSLIYFCKDVVVFVVKFHNKKCYNFFRK